MKFKYSALTENTPEMREWLEQLGLTNPIPRVKGDYLVTYKTIQGDWYYSLMNILDGEEVVSVDCRSNPVLFQAVTAIRDDTFYKQWVICKNPK